MKDWVASQTIWDIIPYYYFQKGKEWLLGSKKQMHAIRARSN